MTLRKILEAKVGPMTDAEFAEVMDLAETDIRINRLPKKGTSFKGVIRIATRCFIAMSRGNVA